MTPDPEPGGDLRDRFRGALLGTAVGDALGMPVEGLPRSVIRRRHGTVREMLPARLGRGTVTDDTVLAADLARALLDAPGRLDLDAVARRFAEGYDPERGYGGNARRILAAVADGAPWRNVVDRHRLPGGSWANGAAMRVAPVALAFFDRPDRVQEAAGAQAEVTGHSHPVGRAGAEVQALAIHRALELAVAGAHVEPAGFARSLLDRGGDWPDEMRDAVRWAGTHPEARPDEAAETLGTGARASASVPAALWAFLSRPEEPEAAIVRAVNLGGDTDTVGAMAGALAGAHRGESRLPTRWLDALEDGPYGGSELRDLADRLHRSSGPEKERME